MFSSIDLRPLERLGKTLALVVLLAASVPSQAAISQVSSRAAMGGTDTLTWDQLGLESIDPLLGAPLNVVTVGGINATVSNPSGDLFRFDEGGLNTGFAGSFAVGDKLLATLSNPGPLVISFATPVARVGAQIQSLDAGAPLLPAVSFTGLLELFDASNTSLGSFSVNGQSDMLQANTAPFLGVTSTFANISSVRFSISGTPNLDFAINTVSLSVTPVPEPASFLMLLAGGAALIGAARQRRQAAA